VGFATRADQRPGAGKGRAGFCLAPPVDRDKRKVTDYSEFPLSPHGEMLFTLVHSGISSFPNRAVSAQFFETVSRYTDFFKVRKDCIIPTLEAFVDVRYRKNHQVCWFLADMHFYSGLHNDNARYRLQLYYFCYRFIKELRNEIPVNIVPTAIASMKDLLPIVVEIPEPEEPDTDLLSEAANDTTFSSQLYVYEITGILCSLIFKTPEEQESMLLSLVKPLMDDLSHNFQAFRSNGLSDLIPIVRVHHVIMALGNIAKGFPDYPNPVPPNYILPPLAVFTEMAQAILVCLEAMNIFKPIRDAVGHLRQLKDINPIVFL